MPTATFDERIWFAVAEPSRRKLIDILLARGEASASRLAEEVPFTRQAVAKHLAVLQNTGLLRHRKAGREVRFSLEPAGMAQAARELSAAAARWDARLQNIKQLAEAAAREAGAAGRAGA